MDAFSLIVRDVGVWLWTYIFGVALVVGGIYLTIKMKFVQFTTFSDSFRLIVGKDREANQNVSEANKPQNSLSVFQSFCIAEASRVSTGNVVGVAAAILMGGPGSIFWMWMMAFIGACTGFVESTLAQIYKENHGDRFMGGPMYYFQRAFKNKAPCYVIAIIIAFVYGFVFNSIHSNTITDLFQAYVPHRIVVGIAIAALYAFIIFGGLKRIVQMAVGIMPFVIIFYLLVCIGVILLNIPLFFATMGYIVRAAFGYEQIAGGAVGFYIGHAVQQGLRRGLFSNEAGLGTVPIAAATSAVSHPVKQGLVQGAGVFLDTIIICSATAFLILMSGAHTEAFATGNVTGIMLVRNSFSYWIGAFANPFINLMMLLLPITSIIGNYFYGETCVRFVSKKPSAIIFYKVLTVALIIAASLAPFAFVWNMADIFTGILVTFNIIVLFKLGNIVAAALEDYKKQLKAFKKGEGPEPVFYDDEIGIDTPYWKRNR